MAHITISGLPRELLSLAHDFRAAVEAKGHSVHLVGDDGAPPAEAPGRPAVDHSPSAAAAPVAGADQGVLAPTDYYMGSGDQVEAGRTQDSTV